MCIRDSPKPFLCEAQGLSFTFVNPPSVVLPWIQLPGLHLLKSSIAVIVFMAPPLAVPLASFPQPL